MKKTKIALTLVCAILLVAASVMGTLAYLTATTAVVKNTFTVGDNVAITLDEAKTNDVGQPQKRNDDGSFTVVESVANATRVLGNEYKLIPGHTYTKDPTVHVTGPNCYIFVTVDNAIASIEGGTTIASQMSSNNWKKVTGYTNLYVYAENSDAATIVTTGANKVVFGSFTINGDQTYTGLSSYNSATNTSSNIKIVAYAIQADSMTVTTAEDLWTNINGSTAIVDTSAPVAPGE